MRRASMVMLVWLSACVARPADESDSDPESTGDETADDETAGRDATTNDTVDDGPPPPPTTGTTAAETTSSPSTDTTTATTGDPAELSHASDIQPIFEEHCVEACHAPDGEWAIVVLAGDAYDAIVGVTAPTHPAMSIIEPGNPSESYLWHKINGTQIEAGGAGLTMPKARPGMEPTVLTPEQISTIEQWIVQGAAP